MSDMENIRNEEKEKILQPGATTEPEVGKSVGRSLLEGVIYYLSILLKYKWFLIIITFLGSVGIVVFAIISIKLPPEKSPLPNMYTANAIIAVKEPEVGGMDTLLYSMGLVPPGARAGNDYGQLAIRIMTTRSFLDQVAEAKDVIKYYGLGGNRAKIRSLLLSKIEFRYDRNINTLVITYTDINAEYAKDMVNCIVELLNEWFTEHGGTDKLNQIKTLEEKLAEVSTDIMALESEIQVFQTTHGVISIEDLAATQTEILSDLQVQLINKELEIKNYATFSRIEDLNLRRLKSERDNILEMIEQIKKGYTAQGKIMPAIDEVPRLSLQYSKLVTDLQIQRRIYESLSQQYEVVKLAADSEPVFKVLDWAEAPDEKSGPQRGIICVGGAVGSLALGCIIVFAYEFFKYFGAAFVRLRKTLNGDSDSGKKKKSEKKRGKEKKESSEAT